MKKPTQAPSFDQTLATPRVSRRVALRRFGEGSALAALVAVGTGRPEPAAALNAHQPGQDDADSSGQQGGERDIILEQATLDTLPASDPTTRGRLRHLTDDDRGAWLDTGEQWVSLQGRVFNVRAFGATGDGQTDDWDAFRAAIEAMTSHLDEDTTSPYGQTLYLPPGAYRLSQTLVLDRSVRLVGAGPGGRYSDAILQIDPGIIGIVVKGADPLKTGRPGRQGEGTIIERLRITVIQGEGAAATAATETGGAHGVWLKAPATVRLCDISGFDGDGIHIEAEPPREGGEPGNEQEGARARAWEVSACQVTGCGGHGLYASDIGGGAGVCAQLVTTRNGGWGIRDDGPSGNTYVACRAEANGEGGFSSAGAANRSLFSACWASADQGRSGFADETLVVGGNYAEPFEGGNAWTATGSRMLLQAQTPGTTEVPLQTAPTLRLRGAEQQTQPHLSVTDAEAARQLEFDIEGRMFIGPLDPATITGGAPESRLARLHLSDDGTGSAGIRWVVLGDFTGWVAQARAFRDPVAEGTPGFGDGRLTFQTPDINGNEINTLTLRDGRVGIGATDPSAAAVLDLASTTQGFLPPRMAADQRDEIPSPPPGLMIYNTATQRLNLYDGQAWRELGFTDDNNDNG